MNKGHQILQPADCKCDKKSGRCPTCDGGLAVCRICGKAEIELDDPCFAATNNTCPRCSGSFAATGGRAVDDYPYCQKCNAEAWHEVYSNGTL